MDPALFLVAGILASTDRPRNSPDPRAENAEGLARLRPVARHKLALAADASDFAYALQNVAAIEDLGVWIRLAFA